MCLTRMQSHTHTPYQKVRMTPDPWALVVPLDFSEGTPDIVLISTGTGGIFYTTTLGNKHVKAGTALEGSVYTCVWCGM